MSIRSNKARAERLAAEVRAERRARREHSAQAKAILLRRLGSPGGLAVCFGAGAVTGFRLGEAGRAGEAERDDGDRPDDGPQRGSPGRFADSTLGSVAIRLAAAMIVRYLLTRGGDGNGGEADDMTAAGGH